MERKPSNLIQAEALVPSRDDRIARLERALVLAAYIVLHHGEVYAPYVDRLEQELKAAREDGPSSRARRIIERYALPVDSKPMPALPAART
jgi:hypothetical protein